MAGYKVKIEWVDTYKERQTANLWLFLVQSGEFDRAMKMVNEKACSNNGFKEFANFKDYHQKGYLEGAKISKMYLNDRGQPMARVEMPNNPEFSKMFLQVNYDGNKFQINEVIFESRDSGIIRKVLDSF